jgi:hypothetical protein
VFHSSSSLHFCLVLPSILDISLILDAVFRGFGAQLCHSVFDFRNQDTRHTHLHQELSNYPPPQIISNTPFWLTYHIPYLPTTSEKCVAYALEEKLVYLNPTFGKLLKVYIILSIIGCFSNNLMMVHRLRCLKQAPDAKFS